MKGLALLTMLLVFAASSASASAEFYELTPTDDDNYINNDTVINFSASPYNINDSNSNGVLIINASDITLDCNGSSFIGNENGGLILNVQPINITVPGYGNVTVFGSVYNNVTVLNCNISGYRGHIVSAGNNHRFYNNYFHNFSVYCIALINSSNSYIGYNTFLGNGYGEPIELGITDSVHIDSNDIQNFSVGISDLGSANLTLSGNTIINNQYGIWSHDTRGLSFSSDTVRNNHYYDLRIENTTSLDLNGLDFGNATVIWFVNVNVTDPDGNPGEDAEVEVFDKDGNRVNYMVMDEYSVTSPYVEYIINVSGRYNFTPHTFNVSKDGYLSTNLTVNIDKSMNLKFVMYPIPQDTMPPIISVDIDPLYVLLGENITMNITAIDNVGIDNIYVSVTDPNSSTYHYNFIYTGLPEINLELNYSPALEGIYSVFADTIDTENNTASRVSRFVGIPGFRDITSTVRGFSDQILETTLILFFDGVSPEYFRWDSAVGDFIILDAPDMDFNIHFSSHSSIFRVTLIGVNITQNNAGRINMDLHDNTQPGYGHTYAAETNYTFSSSELTLYYIEDDFSDEDNIEIYRCSDWEFSERLCNGTWEEIVPSEHNTTGDYVKLTTTGFSAFTIREFSESVCGDGFCQIYETPDSCEEDCACFSGDSRPCDTVRLGICSTGNEDCVNGAWVGCSLPATETCNGLDDDCDGIVDNVGGGNSVGLTQCGCFGGALSVSEICDGIDNDCDGEIDENGDCCTSGDTRDCGPSTDAGICQFGVSECGSDNIWDECKDAVYPEGSDQCFNNLDDDCDGDVDEFCDHCTNEVMDYDETGVDCGGSCDECRNPGLEALPFILVGMGAVVIIVLAALYMYFRRQGKELTWEELRKKYSHNFFEPQILQ